MASIVRKMLDIEGWQFTKTWDFLSINYKRILWYKDSSWLDSGGLPLRLEIEFRGNCWHLRVINPNPPTSGDTLRRMFGAGEELEFLDVLRYIENVYRCKVIKDGRRFMLFRNKLVLRR